ncbi:hypothetical protein Anas_10076 [Armadillidium nasatum]|uniref:Uncharacterized protein n=1 Tax=Armadillidium nasatum TaxID=96803 RepID=A0A5N5TCE9_9CRUS|nr:hypothetical protein Anas_10076 [Armadillidium nasatum]
MALLATLAINNKANKRTDLFFQNSNPGIRYEYRLPMSSGKVLSFQTRSGAADTRWPSRVIYPGTLRQTIPNHRFGYARNPVETFYKPNVYISSPQLLADEPSYIDGVVNPLFGFNSSYLLSKENSLPGYSFQPSGYPYEKDSNVSLNINTFTKAVKSELDDPLDIYAKNNNNNNYRLNYPFTPANTHSQAWKHSLTNPVSKSLYPQAINPNYNIQNNKLDLHYLNSYQSPVHQPSLKSGFQNALINTNQDKLSLSTNQIGTNRLLPHSISPHSISPNSIFYHQPKIPSGTQTSRIVCRKRKKGGVMVPPHFCANLSPPKQHVLTCNLKPCPPNEF